jgi:D-3-phosphoglycerate dehydrogenase / 2-oxoglutarate reductase
MKDQLMNSNNSHSGRILTSPSSFGQVGKKPLELLEKNGFSIVNNPFGRKLTENEVIEYGRNCVGIVAGVEPITRRVIDSLTTIKCISRVGVGMESIDIEYAKSKGIIVLNTPYGPTRAVAEFTLAMTLSLLRRIPQADARLKQKIWEKQMGSLLYEKVIGIIGLGRIGRMVAELFRGIGNKVISHDLLPDAEWANENGIEVTSFQNVLENADILTLHVPSIKGEAPIVGSNEMNHMKAGSYLINIARAGVVDELSLYNALVSGKIAGAAIDVFSTEPYDGELCGLDNVVLTPHLGSYAREGKLQMEIDATQNLIDALRNGI